MYDFQLFKDPENTEAADLQRKLEMLNNTVDQEARAEQARRQILYNAGHCKYVNLHLNSFHSFCHSSSLELNKCSLLGSSTLYTTFRLLSLFILQLLFQSSCESSFHPLDAKGEPMIGTQKL